jgi:hypothetical protein
VVYDRFNKDADGYGDVSFIFSADVPMFDLTIFVKDVETGKKVAYTKLVHQIAGEDIYIEVVPDDFTIIKTPGEENETPIENLTEDNEIDENITLNDSLITLQEESEENSKISGQVVSIFGEDIKLRNILFYALGGIVLLTAGFFTVKKVRKRKGKGKIKGNKRKGEIRVRKLSELVKERKTEEQKETPQDYYGILSETQKKLEQTQKELSKFKNQERIKEIESKIQRDQQELKKLKGF